MSLNNNHKILLASLNVFEKVWAATSESNSIPGLCLAVIAKGMSIKKSAADADDGQSSVKDDAEKLDLE